MFIVDQDFLSTEQKAHIDNVILQTNFPYYLQEEAAPGDGNPGMCHIGLARPELRPEGSGQFDYNSDFGPFAYQMLYAFAKNNDIKIEEMYRAAVNISFNTSSGRSGTHVDHEFDHSMLVIYLNDPDDKDSDTVIFYNDTEHRVKPEKFKGVCFDTVPHYATFPRFGVRVTAAISFKKSCALKIV